MTQNFTPDKKTIFSGMQPSGTPSLANYLGAIKNWSKLQDEYNCLYCVVDMHSITVRQDPAQLRKKCRDLLMLYIACGLDPEKNLIYYQSHVPAHAELSWILNCFTYVGELNRMTQFKEKIARHADNVNAGLLTYPVLMAADILLFQSDMVPVGEDQKQHLEITRDIAMRFNNLYGETFKVPEIYLGQTGARVMSLQDPTKKMSKSETENMNNVIFLLDSRDAIISKFKKAITDSGDTIKAAEDKPGITNLLVIYSAIANKTIAQAEKEFEGFNYGKFKLAVGEAVADELGPVQKKFKELSEQKDYIDGIIKNSAEYAQYLANKTLSKVKRRVGYPDKIK